MKLITPRNPLAAKLIKKYGITAEKVATARNGRKPTAKQHQEYIKSEHWKIMREKALGYYGRKCYLCGVKSPSAQIDIHHNTYARLGRELLSDLIPLCRGCHERHHTGAGNE